MCKFSAVARNSVTQLDMGDRRMLMCTRGSGAARRRKGAAIDQPGVLEVEDKAVLAEEVSPEDGCRDCSDHELERIGATKAKIY